MKTPHNVKVDNREAPAASGATIEPMYGKQPVKFYPITESQMNQLSSLNDGVTKWKGLRMMAIGILIAFVWDIFPMTGWSNWSLSPLRIVLIVSASVAWFLFHKEAKNQEEELDSNIGKIKKDTVFENEKKSFFQP